MDTLGVTMDPTDVMLFLLHFTSLDPLCHIHPFLYRSMTRENGPPFYPMSWGVQQWDNPITLYVYSILKSDLSER